MRSGFRLGELVTVLAVLAVFAVALFPMEQNCLWQAEMDHCGRNGRDVYVALTRVNTEREPRGEKPLPDGRFTNSTELFRDLIERQHAPGLTYACLAGCGVPVCEDGKLKPENNMWTVVKVWRDELDDRVPIMISRNVDIASLPFRSERQGQPLRLDPEWKTPFGDKGCVMIRKGGAIFRCRVKYATARNVLGDASVLGTPVHYLTPSHEVVAGE